ncbi:protein AF-9 [Phlebotomus argentipes]|uniref:protein AF-9 n=1 Tax=Phlebotomus argentipes TaxID=94469 RepID=UPI002892DF83|nr:protein AF-9 [Phlebotomus argentipes]XP_059610253.1 protein AF-9 [Phlebotomus argentipes]
MSVKVFFEIGHDSSLKAKPTPEGFTHDWELFVRGCDSHDISHFIDKVVFNLHESFPKPKRVVKEPPYSVKESGYAGFVLAIDIYVKNREDPKKISFSYDLDLNMIQRKQTEKFIFTTPSEEFRRKLLKGGGVLMSNATSNLDDKSRDTDERTKGKMSAIGVNDAAKKHKMRPEDPFTNLFGTPITKSSTKVSPDPKSKASPNRLGKPQQPPAGGKSSGEKNAAGSKDRAEKESKSKHSKHTSPHRERSGESKEARKAEEKHERREEKKKDKNYSKDRDKSKEKSVKRPASPKRSPKRPSPSRSGSTGKVEEKSQPAAALGDRGGSSGKKMKKEKKEKSHEKAERKDHKKDNAEKAPAGKGATSEKSDAAKAGKEASQGPKEALSMREKLKEMIKTPPEITVSAEVPKPQERRHEKEGERKHKHKKKDKGGSSKEKKKDKSASASRAREDTNSTPTKSVAKAAQESVKSHQADGGKKASTPLDKLYNELGDRASSDSDMESPASEKTDMTSAMGCENSNSSAQDVNVPKAEEVKSSKKSRAEKKSSGEKKKKRNREDVNDNATTTGKDSPAISKMDPPAKIPRRVGEDLYKNGDAAPNTDEGSSYRSGSAAGSVSGAAANPPLSMDYMSELKDLQHKIMTLQDNNELQQVVEMIAATGQYEITSKTFDFDLCALDKSTVQRLQEFFATS